MTKLFPASQYSKGRSRAVDTETIVNMFAELQSPAAKDIFVLYGRPGLTLKAEVGTGPIRGQMMMGDALYVVSGSKVYRVLSDWTSTELGSISGTGLVSMTTNGIHMAVTTSTGDAYLVTSSAVAIISDPDLPEVYTCDYIDGYTIFSAKDGRFYTSGLLNSTAIDPLDFATAESYPDDLLRVFVDHREVWMFGTESIEVWYNAGLTNPPLARFNDAIIEKGLFSRFSVTKNDNTVFWMANDGIVYKAVSYAPQRISTHAVEEDIASWTEAEMFSFVLKGHTFIVLSSTNGTWVYDVSVGLWYKWNSLNLKYWQVTSYVKAHGVHLVGSGLDGKLYELSLEKFTDNSTTIRSEIDLPLIHSNRDRAVMHSFEVDIESGVGLTDGSDPQIMLRYSDDGFTWSSEFTRSMGKIGEYKKRAIWRMLGPDFRQRTIRLAITDPVKRVIISHYANIS